MIDNVRLQVGVVESPYAQERGWIAGCGNVLELVGELSSVALASVRPMMCL